MSKIPKTNTGKEKPAKKESKKSITVIDYYTDMGCWKMKPVTGAFLERLAEEYIKFFETNTNKVHKVSFIVAKKIVMGTFYRWLEMCPKLKDADKHVEALIFERVHGGAMEKKYEPTIARMTMTQHDSDWKSNERERADVKAKANSNNPIAFTLNPPSIKEVDNEDS